MKFPLRIWVLFCFIFFGGVVLGQNDSIKSHISKANRHLEKCLKKIGPDLELGLMDSKLKLNLKQVTQTWEELGKAYPENANVQFKLGLCYFNLLGKHREAMACFKKACQKMGPGFQFRKDQDFAPFYTQYFLAECYRLDNQPDSAIRNYSEYRNNYRNPPIESEKEVYMAINSKIAENNPRNVTIKDVYVLNSAQFDGFPVFKLDNKQVFFASNRGNSQSLDIYYSRTDSNGKWSNPVPLPFSTSKEEIPLFLNLQGDILYFSIRKNKQTDIYYSRFVEGEWIKPKPFGLVNSSFNENGLCISLDGKQLFFSSDRAGGTGGFDLYWCQRDSLGNWSNPKNLAYPINTSSNECFPNLSPDGKTLYYSSNGLINIGVGGYDVFFTFPNSKGGWNTPQSLNKPINGPGDDFGFYHSGDGMRFFSQLNKDQGIDIISIDGGTFEQEEIAVATEVVTVTNELSVAQIVETEKEVEKEVSVVETIETEKEVEKEIEVTKEIEVEQDLKKLDVNSLDTLTQQNLVEKVKEFIEQKDTLVKKPEEPIAIEESKQNKSSESPESPQVNLNENTALSSNTNSSNKVENEAKPEVLSLESPNLENVRMIYFDLNSAELPASTKNLLEPFIRFLRENTDWTIEVVGHSDQKGEWEWNLELSVLRAKRIKEYLEIGHVSGKRIKYYGVGNTKLVAEGLDEESRKKNRRVEIKLIPKKPHE